MAKGAFILEELPTDGSQGARFEWTSDRKPANELGGGRACPVQPWSLVGRQRQVRTDYPEARRPTAQILGHALGPSTLSGRFDDRYNFAGYAIGEMRRLEAMIARGNPVRCSFLSIAREGIITDYEFEYRREWWIGYKFTLDTHDDVSNPKDPAKSPDTVESPAQHFDKLDAVVQAMLEVHSTGPAPLLAGDLNAQIAADLSSLTTNRENLGATLDNRELRPPENPVDAFTRLSTQFGQVRAAAFNAVLTLAAARSDTAMVTQTAIGVLDFETWSRGIRFMARIATRRAITGAEACKQRASPNARHIYRPHRGESLYEISRRFYGTPHAWQLIYQRNALRTFNLTGDEVLIIPERGGK